MTAAARDGPKALSEIRNAAPVSGPRSPIAWLSITITTITAMMPMAASCPSLETNLIMAMIRGLAAMPMIEDFMLRAALGGLGVAGVAGPLGCFVIWRRMVYFGAALAHSALLGVALGLALGVPADLGIAVLCLAMALGFLALDRGRLVASDTLLGILAHASLALGLLALTLME